MGLKRMFCLVFEIMCGLNHNSVYRLRKSTKKHENVFLNLTRRERRIYEHLTNFVAPSNNYMIYREVLRSVVGPAIPYIGVLLKDLAFVEEKGAPLKMMLTDKDKGEPQVCIFFDKCLEIVQVIWEGLGRSDGFLESQSARTKICLGKKSEVTLTHEEGLQRLILGCILRAKDQTALDERSFEIVPRKYAVVFLNET